MFHLQPNRNFRNFLVNGKRPRSSLVDVTTAARPILLRLGRATKMAVFWSYFRDFVGAQKIEDLSESNNFFAEVFQIKSRLVLAKRIWGG